MIVLKRKLKDEYSSIEEVYESTCCILEKEGIINNRQNLINSLIQREQLGPVQIMSDFYLPHIKSGEVDELVIANIEGFKDNKVLFIIVPEKDFDMHRECVIRIIMKLDDEEFLEKMGSSEEVFKEYLECI